MITSGATLYTMRVLIAGSPRFTRPFVSSTPFVYTPSRAAVLAGVIIFSSLMLQESDFLNALLTEGRGSFDRDNEDDEWNLTDAMCMEGESYG
jgi:hypothetical protein